MRRQVDVITANNDDDAGTVTATATAAAATIAVDVIADSASTLDTTVDTADDEVLTIVADTAVASTGV